MKTLEGFLDWDVLSETSWNRYGGISGVFGVSGYFPPERLDSLPAIPALPTRPDAEMFLWDSFGCFWSRLEAL